MKNKEMIKPFGATPTYRQIHHLELEKKAFSTLALIPFREANGVTVRRLKKALTPRIWMYADGFAT